MERKHGPAKPRGTLHQFSNMKARKARQPEKCAELKRHDLLLKIRGKEKTVHHLKTVKENAEDILSHEL